MKLLDYAWDVLEASRNPFAVLVQAHLKTLATRGDPRYRKDWKQALTTGPYEKGYDSEEILKLFRFVDWLMKLPAVLERQLRIEIAEFEEKKSMPYVTSFERMARE